MLRFTLYLGSLMLVALPVYAQGVYATLEDAVQAAENEINYPDVPEIQVITTEASNVLLQQQKPAAEPKAIEEPEEEEYEEIEEEVEEPEPEIEVFSPKFMDALRRCEAVKEVEAENEVEIIGFQEGNCQLKYMDFDLSVPANILDNIHSFDDLKVLLKNQDIAHYNYQPVYTYDGLMYAVTACADKTNYFGVEEKSLRHGTEVNRGLTAEYADGVCTIKLRNEVTKDGKNEDYGVVCSLSDEVLDSLEPYFKELAEKYGEKREYAYGKARVLPATHNQETHEADITLMYFMQQNGYCVKNHQ
ncbi:MAG: hypothetical protein J6039_05535 [Alphaproteobacteria bacterium]|nr:hypothetical protein [Alphaproteobacteria bacterium]